MARTPRILIFTAGFGDGHNAAARNLATALNENHCDSIVLDPFHLAHPRVNYFLRKLYLKAINAAPTIWQTFYSYHENSRIMDNNLWMFYKARKTIHELIEFHRPDMVCTTYPVYNLFIPQLWQNASKKFIHASCVTDSISVHSLWYRSPAALYLVPNEQTRQVMIRAGCLPATIVSTGFPVPLSFDVDKPPLPDPEITPKVLLIMNSGKSHALDTIRLLLRIPKIHYAIAVGRDAVLQSIVESMTENSRDRVTLYGWTPDLPRLMMEHHLIVSKAGGATVQESLAAGTPIILTQVVPGQEEGNWALIAENNCGCLADTPEKIQQTVKNCFSNNASLWKYWKKQCIATGTPNGARRSAQVIIDHISKHLRTKQ